MSGFNKLGINHCYRYLFIEGSTVYLDITIYSVSSVDMSLCIDIDNIMLTLCISILQAGHPPLIYPRGGYYVATSAAACVAPFGGNSVRLWWQHCQVVANVAIMSNHGNGGKLCHHGGNCGKLPRHYRMF